MLNYPPLALLQLILTPGLGKKRIWELIEHFKTPEQIILAGYNEKTGLLFQKWSLHSSADAEWERAKQAGIELIPYHSHLYPSNLKALIDPPLLLYVKGRLPQGEAASLALIGTRNASLYGKQQATLISEELASQGITIVSGLARGIDTAAHEGALKGGQTVAFIGSGLGHIYPPENRKLADQIAERGAVISEYLMETPPAKGLFPQRNRLISAFSDGVCLVESPLKGGGMLTMEHGEKQKKLLFTLPGRVDWPSFQGNHALIKQKRAALVENGADLLQGLGVLKKAHEIRSSLPSLTPEENHLVTQMPFEEKTIDELVVLTKLPVSRLSVLLTKLVLKKVVREFPGKIYKKVHG